MGITERVERRLQDLAQQGHLTLDEPEVGYRLDIAPAQNLAPPGRYELVFNWYVQDRDGSYTIDPDAESSDTIITRLHGVRAEVASYLQQIDQLEDL